MTFEYIVKWRHQYDRLHTMLDIVMHFLALQLVNLHLFIYKRQSSMAIHIGKGAYGGTKDT